MTPTRRQLLAAFKKPTMLSGAIYLYGPVGKSAHLHYNRIRALMKKYGKAKPLHWHRGRAKADMAADGTYAIRSIFKTPRGIVNQAIRDASIYPCTGQYPVTREGR